MRVRFGGGAVNESFIKSRGYKVSVQCIEDKSWTVLIK